MHLALRFDEMLGELCYALWKQGMAISSGLVHQDCRITRLQVRNDYGNQFSDVNLAAYSMPRRPTGATAAMKGEQQSCSTSLQKLKFLRGNGPPESFYLAPPAARFQRHPQCVWQCQERLPPQNGNLKTLSIFYSFPS